MKKTLHLWHRYLGLLVAIPLIIISLTGSILVFKEELDHWLMPELAVVAGEQDQRLSYDELRAKLNNQLEGYEIGSWEVFDDGKTADRIYVLKHGTNEWFKVYLDQYQGVVRSEPVAVNHYLTDWLLDLHYKFLIGDTGLWVTGLASLILLFMGISGLVIYRQFWKKFFTLRLKVKRVALFSDIHKLVGLTLDIIKLEIKEIIFALKRPIGVEIDKDLSRFLTKSNLDCLIVFSPLAFKMFSIISCIWLCIGCELFILQYLSKE